MDGSCSIGVCPLTCEEEEDEFDCDECCDEEEVDDCPGNRFFDSPFMLNARGGRPGSGGRGGGGGRGGMRPGGGVRPGYAGGGIQRLPAGGVRPGYAGGGIQRLPAGGVRPGYDGGGIQRYPSYVGGGGVQRFPSGGVWPGYGGGGIRRYPGRYYGGYGGRFFFPGTFAALGLASLGWFSPYLGRYSYWYPPSATPLYITNEYNLQVRNPDLEDIGSYPTLPLPVFDVPVNLTAYSNRQTLTPQEEALVGAQLTRLDAQYKTLLIQLQRNERYRAWVNRGFKVVPDLSQGRFVWVYVGGTGNTNIYNYMEKIKLSCAACGGHTDEVKELVKLTHDQIVFDIYGKYGDDMYRGFYVSRDGNVYAYSKTHGDPTAVEQTTIELLPTLKVDVQEMERLMGLINSLKNAEIKYYRYDSGPLVYDAWQDGKRITVYGDNNSKSAVGDELMRSVRGIIAAK